MEQVVSPSGVWSPLLMLVLASVVVMGSPGPATMSATAVGAAFGLRRSLPYLAGLVAGTTAVLLAVAAGVVSMLVAVPGAAPVLFAVSAVYIAYLAYRIATAPPLSGGGGDVAPPSFAGGFVLAIANPKAYLAIAAVFAGTPLPLGAPAIEAALKTAVLTGMIVLIHMAWLLAGTSLARILRDPAHARIVNLLFAAVLIATTLVPLLRG